MSDEAQNTVIDLDALAPSDVTVHIGGKDVAVKPPSTLTVLKLGVLGKKAQEADKQTDEENSRIITEITALAKASVPDLGDIDLTFGQLMKLVEIISGMGMPTEAKELAERNITTDNADPKVE